MSTYSPTGGEVGGLLVTSDETRVVHLKRRNGQVEQDCSYYIGRACNMGGWRLPTSKYYNPFSTSRYGRRGALLLYLNYLYESGLVSQVLELHGHTLGCWCSPLPCHGDILVAILRLTDYRSLVPLLPRVEVVRAHLSL